MKKKGVMLRSSSAALLISLALSLCLRYIPLFSGISSGFAVILCAVIAAAAGALLHPVKEAHAS